MRTSALVLVEYGPGPRPELELRLSGLDCIVERVRTDSSPGDVLTNPNEALEFSGYQEGLARIMKRYSGAPDDAMTIVFVNDTLAGGHAPALSSLLLRELPRLRHTDRPLLVGLRMPFDQFIASVTGTEGYVSTWAFALCGPRRILERVRFYEPDEVLSCFDSSSLPEAYRSFLQRWLAPTGFFSGWYKALPGVPLDPKTRRRKELAIYLEHRLPDRLSQLGFQTVDIGKMLPNWSAVWRNLLHHVDRLYVNRLKLERRIPFLLRMHKERQ